MSNHVHLVLGNRPDIAEQWSADEIASRRCRVFPPRDDATGEPIEPDLAMLAASSERLSEVRKRLANLSWFMRCLCEKIARASNHEDGSSGRFWAGRFKSVALLDEAAILACSVAVQRVLAEKGIAPAFVAGHSLGEYSALVAAGSLQFADAVRLVRKRGTYMQDAVQAGQIAAQSS